MPNAGRKWEGEAPAEPSPGVGLKWEGEAPAEPVRCVGLGGSLALPKSGKRTAPAPIQSQCRKWRRPVKIMATSFSSHAVIDSASRFEPPG